MIDYAALGKQTDKVFVWIYMKSKEVVEMGYKGWFFYYWLFNGLINRYNLHVYEECYKCRSWQYLNMNVEYQTRCRHSKSYVLLPLRDNKSKLTVKKIYDYLYNRKLIMDYLTNYIFRLVEPEGDLNKSHRDICGFLKSLQSCKLFNVHIPQSNLSSYGNIAAI